MKKQRKRRKLFKRLISGVSAIALSVGLLGSIPASADDSTVGYKYTLFAYSSEDGAITSSAANFCVNGNIATNGTISAGQNFNVNGEKKEHANEAMPDLSKAINEKFFAENVNVKAENYKNEDVNINVESPLDVKGKAELKGNIKLAAGVKAMGDIVLSGGVLNNDNTVLFSENGSININSENVSLTGLIYAPKGNIVIESKSLNLNSVVMIANKITLNAPNVNINNSASMAKFVQEAIDKNGNSSSGDENEEDPEPVTDPAIYAYGEYNEKTKSVDIEWYSNVTGEFAVLESLNGTDYTLISKVSDDTKYSIKVASDFIKKFYKVTIFKDGKTIESIPFSIVNANGKYSTELLDTDKDGLADLYEEMLGTDKTLPDTDKDGLTDYEEAYITNTDPTKYDSVTEGVSDADADNDKDGLTNKREIELKTDPNSDDTDGDNLKDGDELSKYNTDPTKKDTDGDELEDDDEFKFNCDPNKKDTDNNGIIDGKEKHQQTVDVVPDNKEQAVTEVSVSMAATGNVEKTTTIESIMNKDVLCSNVVGLVGEPFSIESESSFDKATITFTVDKTKLGKTEFDNLMFLWYDRENDNFVELETSHDAANSTVSIETTHFSEYILVDAEEWLENWKKIEKETNWTERKNTTVMYYITKCDDKNDPKYLDPDRDNSVFKYYSNNREMVFKHLLSLMSDDDRIGFSSTDDNGKWVSTVFMPKNHFDISKGVNINLSKCGLKNDEAFEIVYAADDLMTFCKNYNNRIVYFTDRDIKVSRSSYSAEFYKNYKKVPVIFVCTGNFDKTNIQKIADETGGAVFNLTSIDELGLALNNYDENPLEKLFTDMEYLFLDPCFKDTDGDGFSNIEEEYGIVTSGGRKIQTNPKTKHTDNDGLADNEEIDVDQSAEEVIIKGKKVLKRYHHMRSDPTKQDSDGDGINDKEDKYPLRYSWEFMDTLKEIEKYVDEALANGVKKTVGYSVNGGFVYETVHYNEKNSIITMNIIRNVKYGSGSGQSTNETMWWATSGDSFNPIRDYINEKNPVIMKKIEKYKEEEKETFQDPDGNDVELLHMMATLSAYYNSSLISRLLIDRELSGWAADLQSMSIEIKGKDNPKEFAREIIGTNKSDNFSLQDMISDVDADNISKIYKHKNYLSDMLEDYYINKKLHKKRYSIFVDNYGGIDALEDLTNEYTSYEFFDVLKHMSFGPIGTAVCIGKHYFLSSITKEESRALTYAFISFLKDQMKNE